MDQQQPLPKADLTEVEIRARAMQATTTESWLDLYSEIIKQGIYKSNSTVTGIAIGNVMEQIRDWDADWKKVAIELKAIEVNALEDVEMANIPEQGPNGRYSVPATGMQVYWPSRGNRPVVFKDRRAISVFHFFSWLISFKDTLGNPQARIDGNRRDIFAKSNINIGM
jgi:hypothetical protein